MLKRLKPGGYIRATLQGIALCGGLFGLFLVYMSVDFLISGGPITGLLMTIPFSLLFALPGIYLMYVSYLVVKKFSIRAIEHFSFILTMIFYFWLSDELLRPFADRLLEEGMRLQHVIVRLVPIGCAIFFFIVLKKVLIALTNMHQNGSI